VSAHPTPPPRRTGASPTRCRPDLSPGGCLSMRPDRLILYPPRMWKVDIVRAHSSLLVVCRTCGPLGGALAPERPLQSAALSHLARHVRRDVTPPHLRTCQCGRRGCLWHRMHRGCTGDVLLALTHHVRSPTWQLADVCRRCCAAIPGTATVPFVPPASVNRLSSMAGDAWTALCEDDGQVWEPDASW
jgi:hypothetical protein